MLLWLAAAVRALVCWRTAVPGRDGATYLWMAEQAANGNPAALFATVFHPFYSALVGTLLRLVPGLDPMVAGQVVAGGCGALAVLPLWSVANHVAGPRAAFWCGIAYATGTWFARHPAECMSEGPFFLLVIAWAHALLGPRRRATLAGIAAALAYLTRPEGLAPMGLGLVWLLHRGDRTGARRFAAATIPLGALLPLGYALFGAGATLTPKAAFNYAVGVGAAPDALAHYAREALALPAAALEELGWLWLPIALFGLVVACRRGLGSGAALLAAPFAVQCAVVPALHSHWRFLAGFGCLLTVFAGIGTVALCDWLQSRHRALPHVLIGLLLASEGRLADARNADRVIERELGRWLRTQLAAGETIASDMPRLDWYAGQRPPPPRILLPQDILTLAAAAPCRFVALVERRAADGSPRRRTALEDAALVALGFVRVPGAALPAAAGPAPDIVLFRRP